MEVQAFDSFEEMQEAMSAAQKSANDGLNGAQRELRDDHEHTRYWIRNFGDFLGLGVAWSTNDHRTRVAKTLPSERVSLDSEDLAECLYEMANYPANRMAGYLSGEVFSIVCPTGELGDTHVSQVMPITKEAFDEAREAGWVLDSLLTPTLIAQCIAIQEYVLLVQNGATE